jgi:kumamolisin
VTRTGPPTTRVPIDGGPPAFPNGDAGETTLDVETIVSLAPGTALYVYEPPGYHLETDITDTYNTVVSDDVVDTLNSSWYGCERQGRQLWKALDAIEKQGSAEGITFHGIAGDRGPHGRGSCLQNLSVNAPGSTPHDIDLGGTTLVVDGNGNETSEIGWNDAGGPATGGGVSVVFNLPSYQKNVPNIIASGRNVPDLAFDADPYTGTSYYFNGAWIGPEGGTSMSSPIFGAALTEMDQLQNSRSGLFNVTLYKTWLANGYGSPSALYFRDITQGSIPPYFAQPGYDQMTGIGAMQVNNFAALLQR